MRQTIDMWYLTTNTTIFKIRNCHTSKWLSTTNPYVIIKIKLFIIQIGYAIFKIKFI